MDSTVGIWKPRISRHILGNANIDFPYNFTSQYIGVCASTTNVNPRNRVGRVLRTGIWGQASRFGETLREHQK